jgi:hypothetical protein
LRFLGYGLSLLGSGLSLLSGGLSLLGGDLGLLDRSLCLRYGFLGLLELNTYPVELGLCV